MGAVKVFECRVQGALWEAAFFAIKCRVSSGFLLAKFPGVWNCRVENKAASGIFQSFREKGESKICHFASLKTCSKNEVHKEIPAWEARALFLWSLMTPKWVVSRCLSGHCWPILGSATCNWRSCRGSCAEGRCFCCDWFALNKQHAYDLCRKCVDFVGCSWFGSRWSQVSCHSRQSDMQQCRKCTSVVWWCNVRAEEGTSI